MFLYLTFLCFDLFSFTFRFAVFFICSFFFNDTATTEIYTLSLHDALPICSMQTFRSCAACSWRRRESALSRSEEHTSELQSHSDIVCRLLLETKNKIN